MASSIRKIIGVGLGAALAGIPIRGFSSDNEPPVAASSANMGSSGADSAIQQQIHDLRTMVERQNRLIEQLQRKLEDREPVIGPLVVPTDRVTSEQSSMDPNVMDALDSRIAVAISNLQAKANASSNDTFEVGKNLDLKASWQNGFVAESSDKSFRVHLGGRTQISGAWIDADNDVQFGAGGVGRTDDAVNFRRARLAAEGTVYEVIDFNFEYDFMNTFDAQRTNPGAPLVANTPVPTDLYVGVKKIPVIGNFRIGNQKPPISFEHLTSSRFLNFMERSLGFDAFIESQDNGFRPGMMIFNTLAEDRATWAIGLFKNNNSIFGWNVGDGEYDVTGRLTVAPWISEDGRSVFHLGIGASHRDLDDGLVRFRSRTLIRNGPPTLHTVLADARLEGDDQDLIVPELVLVCGPWTVQAEYEATWIYDATETFPTPNPADLGTVFFSAYYVEVLYFITGEHRVYDRKYPRFDRVTPNENYFYVPGECGNIFGRGAWQIGARYSNVTLRDSGINGSVVHDVTLGLNWFLNPNLKVQWNYTWAFRDAQGDTSDGDVREAGFQLAFDF